MDMVEDWDHLASDCAKLPDPIQSFDAAPFDKRVLAAFTTAGFVSPRVTACFRLSGRHCGAGDY